MGTCTVNMFPRDKMFAWKIFSDKFNQITQDGSSEDLVKSLNRISSSGEKREMLLTFVGVLFTLSKACH